MNKRKLIIGLRRGDHDSYEALFKLSYVKFVNFADAIIKGRNAAKDAFIKIWANRLKLDETQSLENYIYVIVKRLVLNYIRDHRPSESLESDDVQMVQSVPWGRNLSLLLTKLVTGYGRQYHKCQHSEGKCL